MWQLCHRLFGWHYIARHAGAYSGVVRIRYTIGEGRPYFEAATGMQFYRPETGEFGDWQWTPLTFKRADFEAQYGKPSGLKAAA